MNLQSANTIISDSFYEVALPFLKRGDRLLNLGCGILFNFEKLVYKTLDIKSVCMDIININKLGICRPIFIANFYIKSVEKIFFLKNKFDVITFFEVIEHIDKTDVLLQNCFNNLKDDGRLIFSFPNLASIYARFELLFGFQPHILEVSNKKANFGTGFFGKYNNPKNIPIHHIRGITNKAMIELLKFHGFEVLSIIGYDNRFKKLLYSLPSIAPVNIVICKKIIKN